MNLALFDLDHTLIPCDSDVRWSEFLVRNGKLTEEDLRSGQRFFQQYKNGTLNLNEFLQFQLKPLREIEKTELFKLRDLFISESIKPMIKTAAKDLVLKHLNNGDTCAIVTATNEFITEPIADLFNVEKLIATLLDTDISGNFTGKIIGIPSFRAGKVKRVSAWLSSNGRTLKSYNKSYFYSDSINDLPLLKCVTNPVVTNPDVRLRALANEFGWVINDLF